ncbi:hypothetical protein HDU76_004202 [Blyttiomyces sp. JEL0837]|nr:hypothetical protein HDU76_004202 [Blyttiomyces sp. JEL0837]
MLTSRYFEESEEDNWMLKEACEKGNVGLVKVLLEVTRLDPSFEDNYLIKIALARGFHDIVKLLLKDERVDGSVVAAAVVGVDDNNGFKDGISNGANECAQGNDKKSLNDEKYDIRFGQYQQRESRESTSSSTTSSP